MQRHDIINQLMGAARNSYLEIGVDWGETFVKVTAPEKVGVDPAFKVDRTTLPGVCLSMTSDTFFGENQRRFDCIFIDGLHTHEQSLRDFRNSWEALSDKGFIAIDDCVPADAIAAMPDLEAALSARRAAGEPNNMTWMGDVFRTVIWINDKTRIAYSFVKENPNVVVVWQEERPRRRLTKSDAEIANFDFDQFRRLQLPTASISEISRSLDRRRRSLFSLLRNGGVSSPFTSSP